MIETKSNWEIVAKKIKKTSLISLGSKSSNTIRRTPTRMLNLLSYYKFAAKMIGKSKKILDIGCRDGLGTYLLGTECGFSTGFDIDTQAIISAQNSLANQNIEFRNKDFFDDPIEGNWDAITCFNLIEKENLHSFLSKSLNYLNTNGLLILGISNKPSRKTSSKNLVAIEQGFSNFFERTFYFYAYDEVVHVGLQPTADYLIVICCMKKN